MISVVATLVLLVAPCYRAPISSPVIDPFRAPACSYCPGNRGLEYQPPTGSPVVAAYSGVVRFDGVVAGVRYLVVVQADGRTATYGRLATVFVAAGARVEAGESLATTTTRFFFGLRQGDRYVDPSPFLGVARFRPRLVPIDGNPPRRAPPPTTWCAARP